MRIAILGAGAMGSVFGGLLALADHDVTLVARHERHIGAVVRDGLRLVTPRGTVLTARPRTSVGPVGLEDPEVVIVLTKSRDTSTAAASIAPATPAGTWIVTLQNGLGNDEKLEEVFSSDRVVRGTTTVGARVEAPGTVRMTDATAAGRTSTVIGVPEERSAPDETLGRLARSLTAAGLPTEMRSDVGEIVWRKLAMSGPMASVAALLQAPVGQVLRSDPAVEILRALFDEFVRVACAEGARLDRAELWEEAAAVYEGAGEHVPSMSLDVLNGRPTEIDALAGAVVERGRRHGVETPTIETVVTLVRALETIAVSPQDHEDSTSDDREGT